MAKSAEAFRTISEASDLLDTPAHVLRFWESRFTQVKPVKRAGGRRYYRPSDLALLGGIKKLLHEDGMTIRGVQKILREHGIRHVAAMSIIDISTLGQEAEEEARAEAATAKAPERAPVETALRSVTAAPVETRPEEPLQSDWLTSSEPAPRWPTSPSPDTADESDDLVHDPDDAPIEAEASNEVPEAPMEVDAPLLPTAEPDNVLPLGARNRVAPGLQPNADTVEDEDAAAPMPAAALLRAMDALRARDNRSELKSVYGRLSNLRDRMSRENAKPID